MPNPTADDLDPDDPDVSSWPPSLTATEAALPIPPDVMVVETNELPSGKAWWSPASRVILVDASLPASERPLTLAHECAHMILGHGRDTDGPAIEQAADAFGGFLLTCTEMVLALRALEHRVIELEQKCSAA